jgi:hypothetical protein
LYNKKIVFTVLALTFVIIATLIILLLTHQSKNNLIDGKNNSDDQKTVDKMLKVEEDNDEVSKDPFGAKDKDSVVGGFTFKAPEVQDNAVVENTFPTLLQAGKKYLLTQTKDKTLYLYDYEQKTKTVLDKDVKKAFMTPDKSFVFYTKEILGSDVIYQYDLNLNFNLGPIVTAYEGPIQDIQFSNGILMYSYNTLETKMEKSDTVTKFYVLPEFQNNFPSKFRNKTLNHSSFVSTIYNKNFYAYNPVRNSIDLLYISQKSTVFYKFSQPVKNPKRIEFSPNNKWFLLYQNDKNINEILLNGEKLNGFENIYDVKWFDDTHLLIVDSDVLYLYDINTKQKDVLKTNVANVSFYNTSIFYQNLTGDIYKIEYVKNKND